MENKDIALIVLSALSFLLSLATLFLTFLRPAILSYVIHDRIQGVYANGLFGLLFGLTINNTGARAGLIENIYIELVKNEKDGIRAILNWEYFFEEKNDSPNLGRIQTHTHFSSWPHPITVASKSSETVNIRFLGKESLKLDTGNYLYTMVITSRKKKSRTRRFKRKFVITRDNLNQMTVNDNGVANVTQLISM